MSWKDFFKKLKKSPEEKEREKNKIIFEADIRRLIIICNESMVELDKKLHYVKDSNNKTRLKWLYSRIETARYHLDEAYGFLHADNINSAKNELELAKTEIIKESINTHLDFSIKSMIIAKDFKSKISMLRSNIITLINNIK